MACDLGSGKVCTTSLLVATLLEIYIIVQYIKNPHACTNYLPLEQKDKNVSIV